MNFVRTFRSVFTLTAVAVAALALGGCVPAVLRDPGSVEPTIRHQFGIEFPDINQPIAISAIAVQPDAQYLLGGRFTTIDGIARNGIAQLLDNGEVSGFDQFDLADENIPTGVSGASEIVTCVAVQSDGKVLIAGDFVQVGGYPGFRIARLHQDGSVDHSFDAGSGPNAPVRGMALQADGKILIAGDFNTVNGTGRAGIARLNMDGSLDAGFDPGLGLSGYGLCVAVQADGKILVGGLFDLVNNVTHVAIARLDQTGAVEPAWNAHLLPGREVRCVVVQPDGEILIGGNIDLVSGQSRHGVARLEPDGTRDDFDAGLNFGDIVNTIALQADGKILIGGEFEHVGGQERKRIARLQPDGALDTGFLTGPGADGTVTSLAIKADGKVLMGGDFGSYNLIGGGNIVQIYNDGLYEVLEVQDSTWVTWGRGGAAPEVNQVTFEVSIDGGVNWTLLAACRT